jgi:hypothetical protein
MISLDVALIQSGEIRPEKPSWIVSCLMFGRAMARKCSPYHSLVSYRQEGRYCLQAVVASSPGGAGNHYADLDIDLGNPLQDVQGLLIHLGEVLNPGYIDHLSRQKHFATGATADFMYYTVRKN